MRYEISHGQETFHVEVREDGPDLYHVSVDAGPSVAVDARRADRSVYSLLIEGRQYEASVDERPDGALDVHVGTGVFDLQVVDERRRLLVGSAAPLPTGKQTLRAQLPGKIVKVLVAAGDRVEPGQPLMVIEAMKMENELRSPIAGRVAELGVREGEAVETHALLAIVEPVE